MDEVIKHNDKLWERKTGDKSYFLFWCPGCKHGHTYEHPRWSFNGNHLSPTFKPSLRIFIPADADRGRAEKTVCHLYVTDGRLEFCNDCPHEYNDKKIPMVSIPEDYGF